MNGYGKLCWMTDRDAKIVGFYLYLAAAFVTLCASSSTPATATDGTPGPPPNGSNEPPNARALLVTQRRSEGASPSR
jgi:hypothetical protein